MSLKVYGVQSLFTIRLWTSTLTCSVYVRGYKELGKIDKDVFRITGDKMDFETNLLEKPNADDV